MRRKVKKNTLQLRVPLDKDEAHKFKALKKLFGLTLDTEAARSIINRQYDREFGTSDLQTVKKGSK